MKILLVTRKYHPGDSARSPVSSSDHFGAGSHDVGDGFRLWAQSPICSRTTVLVTDLSDGLAADDILAMENAKYADGRPMFKLTPVVDMEAADTSLRGKEAAMLVIFTRDPAGRLARTVKGDGTSMAFITASGYLEAVLNPVQEKREGLHPIVDVQTENSVTEHAAI